MSFNICQAFTLLNFQILNSSQVKSQISSYFPCLAFTRFTLSRDPYNGHWVCSLYIMKMVLTRTRIWETNFFVIVTAPKNVQHTADTTYSKVVCSLHGLPSLFKIGQLFVFWHLGNCFKVLDNERWTENVMGVKNVKKYRYRSGKNVFFKTFKVYLI